jgi:hypothetical protein
VRRQNYSTSTSTSFSSSRKPSTEIEERVCSGKNLDEIEYSIQLVYKNLVENEYSIDGSRFFSEPTCSSISVEGFLEELKIDIKRGKM